MIQIAILPPKQANIVLTENFEKLVYKVWKENLLFYPMLLRELRPGLDAALLERTQLMDQNEGNVN